MHQCESHQCELHRGVEVDITISKESAEYSFSYNKEKYGNWYIIQDGYDNEKVMQKILMRQAKRDIDTLLDS